MREFCSQLIRIANIIILLFKRIKKISGLAEKILANKEGCYEVLVSVADNSDFGIRESAIRALSSLLEGNPDPLEPSGFRIIAETLDCSTDAKNASLAKSTLNLTLNCCVRHELNRQNLVNKKIKLFFDRLLELFK